MNDKLIDNITPRILSDIRKLIDSSKSRVVKTVSSSMTLLYWEIGARIKRIF